MGLKLPSKTEPPPRSNLTDYVTKQDKSAQDQVETPLGKQLLQVTKAADSVPTSE